MICSRPLYMLLASVVVFSLLFSTPSGAIAIDDMLTDIGSGNIASININIRKSLSLSPVAVSPEEFARFTTRICTFKLSDSMRNNLKDILEGAKLANGQNTPDVYWRVGFYDKFGKEIHYLYTGRSFYDGNDVSAILDGDKMLVNEKTVDWLESETTNAACSRVVTH